MIVDGRLRSYRIHIPPSCDGQTPIPIVFVLHGYGSNALDIKFASEFDDKADDEGFVVVYPNGHFFIKNLECLFLHGWYVWYFWENQKPHNPQNADDVNYIRIFIEYFKNNMNIDTSKIYITGISGGGCMTYRLGAELSDEIAAIAPIAGTIGGKWGPIVNSTIPEPTNSLPVAALHGKLDTNVPYYGGWADGVFWLSVNESVSFWVEHNHCNPVPEIETSESGNIIKETYTNGNIDSDVVLYTVVNGGHEWFGSPYFPPCEISATDNIWDFFEQHPKQ